MSDSPVTPRTIAHQASLSVGFSRHEYRSGLSFPSPGDLPDPGAERVSPALAGRFLTTEPPGMPVHPCSFFIAYVVASTSSPLPHLPPTSLLPVAHRSLTLPICESAWVLFFIFTSLLYVTLKCLTQKDRTEREYLDIQTDQTISLTTKFNCIPKYKRHVHAFQRINSLPIPSLITAQFSETPAKEYLFKAD